MGRDIAADHNRPVEFGLDLDRLAAYVGVGMLGRRGDDDGGDLRPGLASVHLVVGLSAEAGVGQSGVSGRVADASDRVRRIVVQGRGVVADPYAVGIAVVGLDKRYEKHLVAGGSPWDQTLGEGPDLNTESRIIIHMDRCAEFNRNGDEFAVAVGIVAYGARVPSACFSVVHVVHLHAAIDDVRDLGVASLDFDPG